MQNYKHYNLILVEPYAFTPHFR